MGSGSWSSSTYDRSSRVSKATYGTPFVATATARSTGDWTVDKRLDPMNLKFRECRYSADHPQARGVIVALDVTGSMGVVSHEVHADLPKLHELVTGKGYLPDAQILFSAVGDATCDDAPLQVGQFESNNAMDEDLAAFKIEGGGGGQTTESYELPLYIAARHTDCDSWKDGKLGYLFIIGDEKAYSRVKADEVRRLMGVTLQDDIQLEDILAEAREKYHVYFILPGTAGHGKNTEVINFWRNLLGDHFIQLQSPDQTSSTIAAIIGYTEGVIDSTEDIKRDLMSVGVNERTIDGVTKSLANYKATAVQTAVMSGSLPAVAEEPTRKRL